MRRYKTYTPAELTVWIRRLIADGDIHRFYISKAWLHLRNEVLDEQHHECQPCKVKGLVTPASTVHHIKSVRQAPWLALTKSNLLVVCDDCHYNIHHRKVSRWDDERW